MLRSCVRLAALAASLATAVSAQTNGTAQDGQFKVVSDNSGVVAVHMSLMPGNKLLLSERFHEIPAEWYGPMSPDGVTPNLSWNKDVDQMTWAHSSPFYTPNANLNAFFTDTAEFDLNTMNFTMKKYPGLTGDEGYAFCNGAGQMADGGILVAGGDQKYNMTFNGANFTTDGRRDVRVYKDGAYTKVAEMAWDHVNKTYTGRWYPTALSLPNEDVIIMGGHTIYFKPDDPNANNPTYERYINSGAANGTLAPPVKVSILENSFPINMYPVTYVLPGSGKLFVVAGNKSTTIDYAANIETVGPSLPEDNIYPRSFPFAGTNFLEPLTPANKYTPRVWMCGGVNRTANADGPAWWANCQNCRATSQCYHINPEDPNPQWVGENMAEARSQPVTVNLPDGTIALFGGSSIGHQGGNAGIPIGGNNPTKRVMFFDNRETDPAKRWRLGAEATVPRQYHGSAVLLTDGSVIIGGSDAQNFADSRANPYELRLEAFYPPYFQLANRPTIDMTTAPTKLGYGQKFIVPFASAVAQDIKTVSMIKYGTSTHTMNNEQRVIELEVIKISKDKMYVTSPPNSNVAPPGNYMLWAVDQRGAPLAQAPTVNLRVANLAPDAAWDDSTNVQPNPPPAAPSNGAANGTPGTTGSKSAAAASSSYVATAASALAAVAAAFALLA
ncbi:hypothetical protein HDU87_001522 [Geranomyces variabilis]|uniref:Glyoxal oxidase n=1 Tax=Geranomyces variabilis TaxID=109894 RepID=A0AAD5TPI5_9FUNG|nr:hypothetical protein HDU87_001522 [Geranomyces variabilis]